MTICEEVPKLIVVYASQQGNAQAIAEDLREECATRDIPATLYCISKLGKDLTFLQAQDCAIFIASTTGDGDPPDTARKWWRSLHRRPDAVKSTSSSVTSLSAAKHRSVASATIDSDPKQNKSDNTNSTASPTNNDDINVSESARGETLLLEDSIDTTKTVALGELKESNCLVPATPEATVTEVTITDNNSVTTKSCLVDFSTLSYTVLGLGDTNYTNFCNFGKNLDEKLQELGAKRFYACSWADDGIGLELVIEPWLEGLWGTLSTHLHSLRSQSAGRSDTCRSEDCTPILNSKSTTTTDTDYISSRDCTYGGSANNCGIINRELSSSSGNSIDRSGYNNIGSATKTNNMPDVVLTTIDNVSGSDAVDSNDCERDKTVDTGDGYLIEINSASDGKRSVKLPPTIVTKMTDISPQDVDVQPTVDSNEDSPENLACKIVPLSLKDAYPYPKVCEIDHVWRENHILLQLGLPLDAKLTIPKIPAYNTIHVDFLDAAHENTASDGCSYQNGSALPSAASSVFDCDVVEWRMLSNHRLGREVKKAIEVTLRLPDACLTTFQPGDTVGVLARNSPADVAQVLSLLGVTNPMQRCRLTKVPSAKKMIPAHLPESASLQEIFTSCVDFRCLPKKTMLLHLLDCVTDPYEKRCLQELVSREGAEMYRTKVVEKRLTFFDLLAVFTSCHPRVAALLEVLPRLLPRPYSLTSSPLSDSKRISFAYNLTVIPQSPHIMQERRGVCTGALDNLYERQLQDPTAPPSHLSLYLRNCTGFTLPDDPSKPIILVGPGTGVAPFVGFIRHRHLQLSNGCFTLDQLGTSWLFFGCRYSGADELYKEELESFVQNGTLTHLRKCFSREQITCDSDEACDSSSSFSHISLGNDPSSQSTSSVDISQSCCSGGAFNVTLSTGGSGSVSDINIPSSTDVASRSSTAVHNSPGLSSRFSRGRYVQHLVVEEATALGVALAEQDARVLVCGDAANMARDVQAAFVQVMTQQLGNPVLGASFIAQMQKEKKYLQDVWT